MKQGKGYFALLSLEVVCVKRWTNVIAPYLFVAPALLIFLLFVLYPALNTFRYSFFDWRGFGPMEWVGTANYQRALAMDTIFHMAFRNNITYFFGTVISEVVFGLAVAFVLSKSLPLFGGFRIMFFTPMVLSMTIIGILWTYVYHPQIGLINSALRAAGYSQWVQPWLGSARTIIPAVVVTSGWTYAGFFMLLFYAGIKRIPSSLWEAARLDGASEMQVFFRVTLPLLRPVMVIAMLLCWTGSFKAFNLFWVMTGEGGGPYHSGEIVATWLMKQAFQFSRLGYGSALAVIMTVVVVISSVLYLFYSSRQKLEY